MKLKSQTNPTMPDISVVSWPEMQLPPMDRFGMTGQHADALGAWYSALQGALNRRLSDQGREIEDLKAKLKVLTK